MMIIINRAAALRWKAVRLMSTLPRFSLDKDYYQILGVSRQAGDIEIKKQFFKQAKLHHPDIVHSKNQSPAEYKLSQERFKEINEAY